MKNRKRIGAGDFLLLLLSVVFAVGIRSFFAPCGLKEDGSWMSCHWAGQTVAGAAGVLILLSVIHLFVRDGRIKQGLDAAVILVALNTMLIPNHQVTLCMMPDMRCHRIMTPAVMICSILLAITAVLDGIYRQRVRRKHED